MIDGKNIFGQPVKSDLRTCDNIWKTATCERDDYTTCYLLDYPCFKKKHCKIIAIGLCKQQSLDADPKAMQQINFIRKLD